MKYLLIVLLLVAVLITTGCVSQPQTPTTTISYNVVVPTDTIRTVATIAKPISPVPKPTLIDYTGKSGWVSYTNTNDHFRIYKPSDWIVVPADKSEIFDKSESLYQQTMNDFVYIYTPNMKGFIMIYGVDSTGTLYSIFEDKEKTQISNKLYDDMVTAVKNGETDQVKFNSIQKDSNFYLINGNPARRMTIYATMGGESMSGDCYVIANGYKYYFLLYSAMTGSTQSDSSTASNIMRSFTTIA